MTQKHTISDLRAALKTAGFEVTFSETAKIAVEAGIVNLTSGNNPTYVSSCICDKCRTVSP